MVPKSQIRKHDATSSKQQTAAGPGEVLTLDVAKNQGSFYSSSDSSDDDELGSARSELTKMKMNQDLAEQLTPGLKRTT